jgi:hypothetical protein
MVERLGRYAGTRYDFPGVRIEDGIPIAECRCRKCGRSFVRRFPLPENNGCNDCQDFTGDVTNAERLQEP